MIKMRDLPANEGAVERGGEHKAGTEKEEGGDGANHGDFWLKGLGLLNEGELVKLSQFDATVYIPMSFCVAKTSKKSCTCERQQLECR